jgi:hypothetical protein
VIPVEPDTRGPVLGAAPLSPLDDPERSAEHRRLVGEKRKKRKK